VGRISAVVEVEAVALVEQAVAEVVEGVDGWRYLISGSVPFALRLLQSRHSLIPTPRSHSRAPHYAC